MKKRTLESEPLINHSDAKAEQEKEIWDGFEVSEKEDASGSTASSNFFPKLEVASKAVVYVLTFVIMLTAGVVSKGTLLFMTSQISESSRPYCNRNLGRNKQFVVTLPLVERAAWMWMLAFAYFVPQAGTFVRSVRICIFKKWQFPKMSVVLVTVLTETLTTIGTAILVFHVLPEMDVIKGAMLTNAVCFIPAVVGFFCRSRNCPSNIATLALDIISMVAQASAFVVWPILEGKSSLWLIPVSVILISIGNWENYVTEDCPFPAIRRFVENNKFPDKYFAYIFISVWKCLIFFLCMILIIYGREGELEFLFKDFKRSFADHSIRVEEIMPIIQSANTPSIPELISIGKGTTVDSMHLAPVWVWLTNVLCTYIVYVVGKFACKVMIQQFSFAFPLNLVMPVTISALIAVSGAFVRNECAFASVIPYYLFFDVPPIYFLKDFLGSQHAWIWLIWLLSQAWITAHTWSPMCERQARTEKLFMRPMYHAFLVDQDVALNRRRSDINKDDDDAVLLTSSVESKETTLAKIPKIYACGTMWHETEPEMKEFLKSVLRMDQDQAARKHALTFFKDPVVDDYYEMETHIFFDDAFMRYKEDEAQLPYLNEYVKCLVDCVPSAVTKVHGREYNMYPVKYSTPYGGRLIWTLPGKTKLIAHLKDKKRIRPKKRWSQVMYMYYLLGYNLVARNNIVDKDLREIRGRNTFILALDGDIDFQPNAVLLLVDLMKKNEEVGAACGRIHPIGSGPMVWYQMFEYAVGHWLQKATEHMIGCVLCSPGCFSLFRGSALMDVDVMKKYTTVSSEARHYVQYDQGEDRWLCTLLLQQGFRVEYSAASDAYTHCPESFNEFYTQRRRWMPSTTANILELLQDYKNVVSINPNISRLYIAYQVVLMVGTVLGPGTIFLMLVGAFVAAFQLDQWSSFLWNVVPILFFMLICKLFEKDKIQLFFAALISAIYGLVMMAVLVGVMLQIVNDGPLAPSSLFFFCVAGEMIITGFLHPKEINCLPYGIIYYVTVPSMYMLLVIYTIFNMNNVSWGTREVTLVAARKSDDEVELTDEEKKALEEKKKAEERARKEAKKNQPNAFMKWWCRLIMTPEKANLNDIHKNIQQIVDRLDRMTQDIAEEPKEQKSQTVPVMEGPEGVLTKTDLPIVDNISITPEEDDDNWMDDPILEQWTSDVLPHAEETFWRKLIQKYLSPIDSKSEKVEHDLRKLRDMSVNAFFMLNALFVLVVFLLTLKKDLLHIKWPFGVKSNFTYVEKNEIIMVKEYLQLEPIGLVFLIFFAILLVVQFIAMLFHRFSTFCQIMANTEMRSKEQVKVVDIMRKMQAFDDLAKEKRGDGPVGRRTTVANVMQAHKKKTAQRLEDMDDLVARRITQIKINFGNDKDNLGLTKKELKFIQNNTEMDERRKTVRTNPHMSAFQVHFANIPATTDGINNLGYVSDTSDI